ncbi:hypothetical protein OU994_16765 [Pseudoduganella sp. SL102]|uniref:hypothetical protein n=1 Tax=Pseudoduganella sp. SL102 TaxID=2995154 RepID=UPI00248BCFD7|nr:hypothetical protein [Pseudoduganella sp. SL102]WBR99975.1 hypothetical protein OU994_16765 [Pseudoduganella sp. SL102]
MHPIGRDTTSGKHRTGGVVWDPAYPLDFSMSAAPVCLVTDAGSGTLSGFGFVTTLNGAPPSVFIPGGELTFSFSGFVPVSSSADLAWTSYMGGRVDFFTRLGSSHIERSDPLAMNADAMGQGAPWLSLVGSIFSGATLRTTVNAVSPPNLACLGQLLVVGGVAAPCFTTHTQPGGADLAFSGSFTQPQPGDTSRVFGTANFFGATVTGPARETVSSGAMR